MSTRQSIFYDEGLHVFWDAIEDGIWINQPESIYFKEGEPRFTVLHPNYSAIRISEKGARELVKSLLECINERYPNETK